MSIDTDPCFSIRMTAIIWFPGIYLQVSQLIYIFVIIRNYRIWHVT